MFALIPDMGEYLRGNYSLASNDTDPDGTDTPSPEGGEGDDTSEPMPDPEPNKSILGSRKRQIDEDTSDPSLPTDEPDTFEPDTFEPDTFEPETDAPDTFDPDVTDAPDSPDSTNDTSDLPIHDVGPHVQLSWCDLGLGGALSQVLADGINYIAFSVHISSF